MKANYHDIISRIPENPLWHDQNGTPRYDEFHPKDCPKIYASQVVLLRIKCQHCLKAFDVEMHNDWFSPLHHPTRLNYGVPPCHGCTGDDMNCSNEEVLQAWFRTDVFDWERKPELEGPIDARET